MGMDLPLPAIERQIASGLDIIVHLGRLRDKSRKVLEVTEVLGYWDGQIHLQTIYRYEEIGKEDEKVTENEKKDQENKVHGEWKKVAGLTSVTVVCDDGLNADGLSTACFVLGKEKAEELLKKYNADGLFVDDSDHVWMTEGMKERFQLLKDTYSIGE